MELNPVMLKKIENMYDSGDEELFANTISNNSIQEVFLNRSLTQNYTYSFTKKIPTRTKISDQEHSGRCWLFSFTNMLRISFIKKYKLKEDFYFSNTHLFFYDKLEKAFFFLKNIEKTKKIPYESRSMSFLLSDPVGDGGFWNMACNLINKYGLVPESNMRESRHSSDTEELCDILKTNLLIFTKDIRSGKKYNIDKMMAHIYKILCYFLGKPLKKFSWEYYNKKDKLNTTKMLTPLEFSKKFVKFKSDEYICLVNYPLKKFPMYKKYSIKYCNNMVGGDKTEFLNVPIKDMRKYTILSLNKNHPVWFGSDVGKFFQSSSGILDENVFTFDKLFQKDIKEFSKRDRIILKNSSATHAMVFIGYDKINKKTCDVDKWLVENSWGEDIGNLGYMRMSNKWFNKFVYQVIVKKALLSKEILKVDKSKAKIIMPWDSLSCDAMMLK